MNSEEKIASSKNPVWAALQLSNRQVWLQALGRALSQIGSGLIYFYIPLVFVNQVGLSATSVGFSVGLSSLTGIVGHILGGVLADSPRFGRKITLIFSAALGIGVALLLAVTRTLPLLMAASLLLGISVGFYWTAADAAVMDVTQPEERSQAFALMSVAENLGNGVGILGGGLLLALANGAPQLLFSGCGGFFLAFLLMVGFTMSETRQPAPHSESITTGLFVALKDISLLVFILANVLFTTYIALVTSTVPLYFTNFVPAIAGGASGGVANTANLFTWCYIGVGAVLQIPIAQLFSPLPKVRVLMVALLMWTTGFTLVWLTGTTSIMTFAFGVAALCMMAIASVTYKPFAAAIVSDLAPASLRGAYVAISSQCWAIGYFVGPTIGGWAMDQPAAISHRSWLVAASTTAIGFAVLLLFNRVHSYSSDLSSKLEL